MFRLQFKILGKTHLLSPELFQRYKTLPSCSHKKYLCNHLTVPMSRKLSKLLNLFNKKIQKDGFPNCHNNNDLKQSNKSCANVDISKSVIHKISKFKNCKSKKSAALLKKITKAIGSKKCIIKKFGVRSGRNLKDSTCDNKFPKNSLLIKIKIPNEAYNAPKSFSNPACLTHVRSYNTLSAKYSKLQHVLSKIRRTNHKMRHLNNKNKDEDKLYRSKGRYRKNSLNKLKTNHKNLFVSKTDDKINNLKSGDCLMNNTSTIKRSFHEFSNHHTPHLTKTKKHNVEKRKKSINILIEISGMDNEDYTYLASPTSNLGEENPKELHNDSNDLKFTPEKHENTLPTASEQAMGQMYSLRNPTEISTGESGNQKNQANEKLAVFSKKHEIIYLSDKINDTHDSKNISKENNFSVDFSSKKNIDSTLKHVDGQAKVDKKMQSGSTKCNKDLDAKCKNEVPGSLNTYDQTIQKKHNKHRKLASETESNTKSLKHVSNTCTNFIEIMHCKNLETNGESNSQKEFFKTSNNKDEEMITLDSKKKSRERITKLNLKNKIEYEKWLKLHQKNKKNKETKCDISENDNNLNLNNITKGKQESELNQNKVIAFPFSEAKANSLKKSNFKFNFNVTEDAKNSVLCKVHNNKYNITENDLQTKSENINYNNPYEFYLYDTKKIIKDSSVACEESKTENKNMQESSACFKTEISNQKSEEIQIQKNPITSANNYEKNVMETKLESPSNKSQTKHQNIDLDANILNQNTIIEQQSKSKVETSKPLTSQKQKKNILVVKVRSATNKFDVMLKTDMKTDSNELKINNTENIVSLDAQNKTFSKKVLDSAPNTSLKSNKNEQKTMNISNVPQCKTKDADKNKTNLSGTEFEPVKINKSSEYKNKIIKHRIRDMLLKTIKPNYGLFKIKPYAKKQYCWEEDSNTESKKVIKNFEDVTYGQQDKVLQSENTFKDKTNDERNFVIDNVNNEENEVKGNNMSEDQTLQSEQNEHNSDFFVAQPFLQNSTNDTINYINSSTSNKYLNESGTTQKDSNITPLHHSNNESKANKQELLLALIKFNSILSKEVTKANDINSSSINITAELYSQLKKLKHILLKEADKSKDNYGNQHHDACVTSENQLEYESFKADLLDAVMQLNNSKTDGKMSSLVNNKSETDVACLETHTNKTLYIPENKDISIKITDSYSKTKRNKKQYEKIKFYKKYDKIIEKKYPKMELYKFKSMKNNNDNNINKLDIMKLTKCKNITSTMNNLDSKLGNYVMKAFQSHQNINYARINETDKNNYTNKNRLHTSPVMHLNFSSKGPYDKDKINKKSHQIPKIYKIKSLCSVDKKDNKNLVNKTPSVYKVPDKKNKNKKPSKENKSNKKNISTLKIKFQTDNDEVPKKFNFSSFLKPNVKSKLMDKENFSNKIESNKSKSDKIKNESHENSIEQNPTINFQTEANVNLDAKKPQNTSVQSIKAAGNQLSIENTTNEQIITNKTSPQADVRVDNQANVSHQIDLKYKYPFPNEPFSIKGAEITNKIDKEKLLEDDKSLLKTKITTHEPNTIVDTTDSNKTYNSQNIVDTKKSTLSNNDKNKIEKVQDINDNTSSVFKLYTRENFEREKNNAEYEYIKKTILENKEILKTISAEPAYPFIYSSNSRKNKSMLNKIEPKNPKLDDENYYSESTKIKLNKLEKIKKEIITKTDSKVYNFGTASEEIRSEQNRKEKTFPETQTVLKIKTIQNDGNKDQDNGVKDTKNMPTTLNSKENQINPVYQVDNNSAKQQSLNATNIQDKKKIVENTNNYTPSSEIQYGNEYHNNMGNSSYYNELYKTAKNKTMNKLEPSKSFSDNNINYKYKIHNFSNVYTSYKNPNQISIRNQYQNNIETANSVENNKNKPSPNTTVKNEYHFNNMYMNQNLDNVNKFKAYQYNVNKIPSENNINSNYQVHNFANVYTKYKDLYPNEPIKSEETQNQATEYEKMNKFEASKSVEETTNESTLQTHMNSDYQVHLFANVYAKRKYLNSKEPFSSNGSEYHNDKVKVNSAVENKKIDAPDNINKKYRSIKYDSYGNISSETTENKNMDKFEAAKSEEATTLKSSSNNNKSSDYQVHTIAPVENKTNQYQNNIETSKTAENNKNTPSPIVNLKNEDFLNNKPHKTLENQNMDKVDAAKLNRLIVNESFQEKNTNINEVYNSVNKFTKHQSSGTNTQFVTKENQLQNNIKSLKSVEDNKTTPSSKNETKIDSIFNETFKTTEKPNMNVLEEVNSKQETINKSSPENNMNSDLYKIKDITSASTEQNCSLLDRLYHITKQYDKHKLETVNSKQEKPDFYASDNHIKSDYQIPNYSRAQNDSSPNQSYQAVEIFNQNKLHTNESKKGQNNSLDKIAHSTTQNKISLIESNNFASTSMAQNYFEQGDVVNKIESKTAVDISVDNFGYSQVRQGSHNAIKNEDRKKECIFKFINKTNDYSHLDVYDRPSYYYFTPNADDTDIDCISNKKTTTKSAPVQNKSFQAADMSSINRNDKNLSRYSNGVYSNYEKPGSRKISSSLTTKSASYNNQGTYNLLTNSQNSKNKNYSNTVSQETYPNFANVHQQNSSVPFKSDYNKNMSDQIKSISDSSIHKIPFSISNVKQNISKEETSTNNLYNEDMSRTTYFNTDDHLDEYDRPTYSIKNEIHKKKPNILKVEVYQLKKDEKGGYNLEMRYQYVDPADNSTVNMEDYETYYVTSHKPDSSLTTHERKELNKNIKYPNNFNKTSNTFNASNTQKNNEESNFSSTNQKFSKTKFGEENNKFSTEFGNKTNNSNNSSYLTDKLKTEATLSENRKDKPQFENLKKLHTVPIIAIINSQKKINNDKPNSVTVANLVDSQFRPSNEAVVQNSLKNQKRDDKILSTYSNNIENSHKSTQLQDLYFESKSETKKSDIVQVFPSQSVNTETKLENQQPIPELQVLIDNMQPEYATKSVQKLPLELKGSIAKNKNKEDEGETYMTEFRSANTEFINEKLKYMEYQYSNLENQTNDFIPVLHSGPAPYLNKYSYSNQSIYHENLGTKFEPESTEAPEAYNFSTRKLEKSNQSFECKNESDNMENTFQSGFSVSADNSNLKTSLHSGPSYYMTRKPSISKQDTRNSSTQKSYYFDSEDINTVYMAEDGWIKEQNDSENKELAPQEIPYLQPQSMAVKSTGDEYLKKNPYEFIYNPKKNTKPRLHTFGPSQKVTKTFKQNNNLMRTLISKNFFSIVNISQQNDHEVPNEERNLQTDAAPESLQINNTIPSYIQQEQNFDENQPSQTSIENSDKHSSYSSHNSTSQYEDVLQLFRASPNKTVIRRQRTRSESKNTCYGANENPFFLPRHLYAPLDNLAYSNVPKYSKYYFSSISKKLIEKSGIKNKHTSAPSITKIENNVINTSVHETNLLNKLLLNHQKYFESNANNNHKLIDRILSSYAEICSENQEFTETNKQNEELNDVLGKLIISMPINEENIISLSKAKENNNKLLETSKILPQERLFCCHTYLLENYKVPNSSAQEQSENVPKDVILTSEEIQMSSPFLQKDKCMPNFLQMKSKNETICMKNKNESTKHENKSIVGNISKVGLLVASTVDQNTSEKTPIKEISSNKEQYIPNLLTNTETEALKNENVNINSLNDSLTYSSKFLKQSTAKTNERKEIINNTLSDLEKNNSSVLNSSMDTLVEDDQKNMKTLSKIEYLNPIISTKSRQEDEIVKNNPTPYNEQNLPSVKSQGMDDFRSYPKSIEFENFSNEMLLGQGLNNFHRNSKFVEKSSTINKDKTTLEKKSDLTINEANSNVKQDFNMKSTTIPSNADENNSLQQNRKNNKIIDVFINLEKAKENLNTINGSNLIVAKEIGKEAAPLQTNVKEFNSYKPLEKERENSTKSKKNVKKLINILLEKVNDPEEVNEPNNLIANRKKERSLGDLMDKKSDDGKIFLSETKTKKDETSILALKDKKNLEVTSIPLDNTTNTLAKELLFEKNSKNNKVSTKDEKIQQQEADALVKLFDKAIEAIESISVSDLLNKKNEKDATLLQENICNKSLQNKSINYPLPQSESNMIVKSKDDIGNQDKKQVINNITTTTIIQPVPEKLHETLEKPSIIKPKSAEKYANQIVSFDKNDENKTNTFTLGADKSSKTLELKNKSKENSDSAKKDDKQGEKKKVSTEVGKKPSKKLVPKGDKPKKIEIRDTPFLQEAMKKFEEDIIETIKKSFSVKKFIPLSKPKPAEIIDNVKKVLKLKSDLDTLEKSLKNKMQVVPNEHKGNKPHEKVASDNEGSSVKNEVLSESVKNEITIPPENTKDMSPSKKEAIGSTNNQKPAPKNEEFGFSVRKSEKTPNNAENLKFSKMYTSVNRKRPSSASILETDVLRAISIKDANSKKITEIANSMENNCCLEQKSDSNITKRTKSYGHNTDSVLTNTDLMFLIFTDESLKEVSNHLKNCNQGEKICKTDDSECAEVLKLSKEDKEFMEFRKKSTPYNGFSNLAQNECVKDKKITYFHITKSDDEKV